ncbi:MAG: hypothetical protein ACE3JQ_12090 [Paenisporosarcina sp.]
MQKVRIANWLLEVDIERTQEFYNTEHIEMCDCLYCINFIKASKSFDRSILGVFNSLGIDCSKPENLSEFGLNPKGERLYTGFYHFMGRMLAGEYCTNNEWDDKNTFQIKNFRIGFSINLTDVHDTVPKQILQIEFECTIPWLKDDSLEGN